MKKFFILTTVMLSMFYFAESVNAGTLIEPYAGLHMGSSLARESVTKDFTLSGTAVGARVGFQNLGLMVGLNAKMSSFTFKHDTSGFDGKAFDVTTYGAFVGYDFPILLRLWAEYVLAGTGEVEDLGKYTTVSGTRFGVGYKVFPFISLNFELGNLEYTDYEPDAGGTSTDIDKATTYFFSISIPLTL